MRQIFQAVSRCAGVFSPETSIKRCTVGANCSVSLCPTRCAVYPTSTNCCNPSNRITRSTPVRRCSDICPIKTYAALRNATVFFIEIEMDDD